MARHKVVADMARCVVEDRPDWRWWVTSTPLAGKPIHRWYVFPQSFGTELVHALMEDWGLTSTDHVLDPFVGAGTTVLSAKEKGIPATGYDLSPLAVLATRVKVATYSIARLRDLWSRLHSGIDPAQWDGGVRDYPDVVRTALPGRLLGAFAGLDRAIADLPAPDIERDFFRLALLSTMRDYSRAVATGGWLRWVDRRRSAATIPTAFSQRVELMLDDLDAGPRSPRAAWRAERADARSLPESGPTYTAVICSPPYLNRHDYTRVFGVELMFGFLDWEHTRQLRYQSIHSHPEARPQRPPLDGYHRPPQLARAVATLRTRETDPRVLTMVEGYFDDMYLVLREIRRVCVSGAHVACVIGNVQYRGVHIAVDELTADIGEQAGLNCTRLLVARYRGNSAQQMGRYGRRPSRESVVVFRVPYRGGDRGQELRRGQTAAPPGQS